MKGYGRVALIVILVVTLLSLLAVARFLWPQARDNRSWSVWVSFEPCCGAELEHLVIHFQAEPTLGFIESRERAHIFTWNYVAKDKTPIGQVLCGMAQKIYHIELHGRLDDERFTRHLWVSPYGLSARRLPPSPRWHGVPTAPVAWAQQYEAWIDLHENYRDDFWTEFKKLAFKRDRRIKLRLGILGDDCEEPG